MTPRQRKAIQGLLLCSTKKEAAAFAGIGESTLRSYLADPEFQAELRKGFAAMVDDAAADLKRTLSPAVKALREIVSDEEQSASARISAARSLLEFGLRYSEFADILRLLNEDEQNVL